MLIPVRTDYRLKKIPWVNYTIIALNVALYLMGVNGASRHGMTLIGPYMLDPHSPALVQFFTSVFLHANLGHLLGNMLFLWVFGNAINDKFGPVGYLAFYLGGGVLAGAGYLMLAGNAPVLGASGAIAAVCGAYLVLLPRTNVTFILWMFLIIPLSVPSLYAIAFQFIFEIIMTIAGWSGPAAGGVAYAAHASGYLFGIIVAMLLLRLGMIERDDFDMLHLFQQHRRRQAFLREVLNGRDPFGRQAPVAMRVTQTQPADTKSAAELDLRKRISAGVRCGDYPGAAAFYTKLLVEDSSAVLPRQQQLDIANQLMASRAYEAAAAAYELFVNAYGDYEYMGDIYLMLGLLYCRYLHNEERARRNLALAMEKLQDESKLHKARQCLEELDRRYMP
ncbi:MAG TPA: rhomboid family intramembrane serine protease [Phycisphaerae bacterium]|nr:rhomboid family intramembrane serine protease [Phycisphaerae bacterium]HPS52674.1 rhomboid family intramembrane serine protease [Phycisphaerae bacterium]